MFYLTAKLRQDLLSAKEETHNAIQEGMVYKQQAATLNKEMEGLREQERMLTDQVDQQDQVLAQLQQELRAERTRQQDTSQQLQKTKRTAESLQEEVDMAQRREREINNKVNEKNTWQ